MTPFFGNVIGGLLAAHAEELGALEVRDTGKPQRVVDTDEIPPTLDQVRFFAWAARLLEGRAVGEYLPLHDGRLEVGAGDRGRQYRGFGSSGYGKDLGSYGLEDYTRLKHVAQAF
ncbi:MAG: betaine-aldehyde dehydrogenase [Actinomycetota bacterium]|nr:betaine-aldehyde dehydrogenase [Actinomycetota bacterium]